MLYVTIVGYLYHHPPFKLSPGKLHTLNLCGRIYFTVDIILTRDTKDVETTVPWPKLF